MTALVACSPQKAADEKAAGGKPVVMVSIVPESYFVEQVAGDLVDGKVMIPAGANHEMYEPTMDQILSFSKASLYIKVGHPNFAFETAWLDKLLAHKSDVKVVDASAGCELLPEDPHTWLSVKCARKMASNIASALSEIMPSKKDVFELNLKQFVIETDELEKDLKKTFEDLKGRRFYVFHPAWTYFAADFGLEQVALEHGHKEPDTHRVQETISRAKADGAKVIFVQPGMSKVSAELVAREIGGEVVEIDPLAKDWMGGMKSSARAIKEALAR